MTFNSSTTTTAPTISNPSQPSFPSLSFHQQTAAMNQVWFFYLRGTRQNDISGITHVRIEDGVRHIEDRAFYYSMMIAFFHGSTSLLQYVLIADSVQSIGDSSFFGCESLVQVDLSEESALREIKDFAFGRCNSLETIRLPKRLERIGNRCFKDCVSLTRVTFPASLHDIGSRAFIDCRGLTSVDLSECVRLQEINDLCFFGCELLVDVLLPPNLQRIGISAFSVCRSLREMLIPKSVTIIGDSAFDGCTALTMVRFASWAAIPQMVVESTNFFPNCDPLPCIELPRCTLPPALLPRLIHAIFSDSAERGLFGEGSPATLGASSLFSFLVSRADPHADILIDFYLRGRKALNCVRKLAFEAID